MTVEQLFDHFLDSEFDGSHQRCSAIMHSDIDCCCSLRIAHQYLHINLPQYSSNNHLFPFPHSLNQSILDFQSTSKLHIKGQIHEMMNILSTNKICTIWEAEKTRKRLRKTVNGFKKQHNNSQHIKRFRAGCTNQF